MKDSKDRSINYMRVSVTDRCNLRCKYCMPEDLLSIPHERILRYEEITRICGIAANLGIDTIKVTGGEPLVRKDSVDFIRRLKALDGIRNVTLTTNALLLAPVADELMEIGLNGVNISLDSLDPKVYREITGINALPQVLTAIHKAVDVGLRVKLNCVPLGGINEDDILPIVRLAETLPIDVRFIELMPTGAGREYRRVSGDEILGRIKREYSDLIPDGSQHGFGPAHYYKSKRLLGGVGFIEAVSNHFCAGCNRVRLTSEGFFKLCLYHDDGVDLREPMRSGCGDSEIAALIQSAIRDKPERHAFNDHVRDGGVRAMSKIGG